MSRKGLPTGFDNDRAFRNQFSQFFDPVLTRLLAFFPALLLAGPGFGATATRGVDTIGVRLPAAVTEASGFIFGVLTLTRGAPPGGLSVTLLSSDTSAATVPPSIVVSAGNTSAVFRVTII